MKLAPPENAPNIPDTIKAIIGPWRRMGALRPRSIRNPVNIEAKEKPLDRQHPLRNLQNTLLLPTKVSA